MSLPREPPFGQPLSPLWGQQLQRHVAWLTGQLARPPQLAAPGRSSAASARYPFDCLVSGTDLTLRPGTVNNVIPSNMFSTLMLPALPYTRYIVATATCSGGQVSSVLLSVDSAVPGAPGVSAGSVPTSFAALLAIIVDGIAYRTIGPAAVSARPVEAYRADKASPTYGLSPYNIYYTWMIEPAA